MVSKITKFATIERQSFSMPVMSRQREQTHLLSLLAMASMKDTVGFTAFQSVNRCGSNIIETTRSSDSLFLEVCKDCLMLDSKDIMNCLIVQ